MKNLNILSSENDLFLVDFYGKSNYYIFDNNTLGTLGNLCKQYGENGILQIRRYDASKMQFKKISKSLVETLFNWDTETILELKKTCYIK